MALNFFELNHSARVPLAAEIHSRPFLKLKAPEVVSHIAVLSDTGNADSAQMELSQHAILAKLCSHFGVSAAPEEAKYFYYDFGVFRLKWECHTEFATYTFALQLKQNSGLEEQEKLSFEEKFQSAPITHIPEAWLQCLKGRVIVAANVVLDRGLLDQDELNKQLQSVFKGNTLAGSQVMQGGELWSDFVVHADGYSRFVVRDLDMRAQQAGRLVQRVLEIETYRMMALLGLPFAQRSLPQLNFIENELVNLATNLVEADINIASQVPDKEGLSDRLLLEKITRLAARIEKLALENNYRFAASKAYFGVVNARIEELRELRMEGVPMLVEFMERRLMPAMNTCTAIATRQESLAKRIAHSNDLLRTRVGIVQEAQNRQILQSMNTRAAQQLRLQQAVEGLSVAAISYYVVGLIGYVGKAAKDLGWIAHVELLVGVSVPLVLGAVWMGVRRLHHAMSSAKSST